MTNKEKIQLCQEIVDQILAESKRPVCRLRFSQEAFGLTDSHLGGVPYLPHEAAYPIGKDGQPLWLCAQINFSQVPPVEGFPTGGILQFYLSDWRYDGCFGLDSGEAWTVQDQWRVLWHPTVDETVTEAECQAKMPILWENANANNMGRPQNGLDKSSLKYAKQQGTNMEKALHLWRCPDKPAKMSFLTVETEGVNNMDFRFEKLFSQALKTRLPEEDPREFRLYRLEGETSEEREALNRIYAQIASGGCKLGGYPQYVQDDPRLYGEDLDLSLEKWDTLLFQLDDLDNNAKGTDLALNGGTLNFLIRSEDLKNLDFSQVLAQWACT